jgi:alpha-D-xyloside xylohydrolase
MLYYDKLRYRLMPYVYTLAGDAYHKDYTIMRALIMDFPEDEKVQNIGDQFMFGPSLMVCPVYTYKAREREVYLPEGKGWYDFYTGEFFEGGQNIIAEAPYERVPLFVKAGSILPVGPEIEYTSQRPADELTLWVYQGDDAGFELYEDEDINYNYEKGAYLTLPVNYIEDTRSLVIGSQSGSFEGSVNSRKIAIVTVGKENPKGFDMDASISESRDYTGEEIEIKLGQ